MKISAIVLVKDEEELIDDCLDSLSWASEIIVISHDSSDKIISIAKNKGAKVINLSKEGFSERRNFGAKEARGEWLLYVDVDERVTPLLKNEIERAIKTEDYSGYAIPRRNIFLGHEMKWGGWWPDYAIRLIKKDSLIKWEGEIHEQPKIEGKIGKLINALTHFSHRSLSEMVAKTNEWSEIEAKLLFRSNHPKMTWWRFFSVAGREFWYRGIRKLGFLDGPVGIIEIIYQMFSRMITYAKLWEMQLNKSKRK